MAMIRRHWKICLVGLMFVMAAGGWVALSNLSPDPAIGEEPGGGQDPNETPEQIEPVIYSRVQALRSQLGLTNETLAAMGCSQAQANSVLQTLVNWYESKKSDLDTARRNEAEARRALRRATRRVNIGPRDEQLLQDLPNLRSTWKTAFEQEKQAVETAISAVAAVLTEDQQAVREAARDNPGLSSPYRYLSNLSDSEKLAISRAVYTHNRKLALGTAEVPPISDVVSYSQQSAAETVKERIRLKMPGVLIASAKVLPVPEALLTPDLPESEESPSE